MPPERGPSRPLTPSVASASLQLQTSSNTGSPRCRSGSGDIFQGFAEKAVEGQLKDSDKKLSAGSVWVWLHTVNW